MRPGWLLVIRSTGAALFVTAAGRINSVCRSVYYGIDRFIPLRSVDESGWPLAIVFLFAPSKRLADHPLFNEAFHLLSRGH
jgi:hypothetical protein